MPFSTQQVHCLTRKHRRALQYMDMCLLLSNISLELFVIVTSHANGRVQITINLLCEQVKCFSAPLQPSEIVGVKRVVLEKLSEAVNEHGLTLTGFLFLHTLFIEKRRLETTWTVLRKFGYDNDIKLATNLISIPVKKSPDQDGALQPVKIEDLFSMAPEWYFRS
ncbi:hypothetical protein MLD38_036028 [Melastoma candidum]|uniref:Uncharacterized protein n=1 Tax=Melastoma candidum TaxID=119954 RepID=A0ACB9LK95_9MYRT|nr:hypothetical protein MLD38_036028 [Melastoma candidum]